MNCEQLNFSTEHAQKRIGQAKRLFGERIINRVLAWALFLLGASKPTICALLDFKPGSLRTLLYRLQHQGLGALEDRRSKTSSFKPEPPAEPLRVFLHEQDDAHHIRFGESLNIQIPAANPLLLRSFLLCLLNNGVLSRRDVAQALQLSEDRVGRLVKKLNEQDIMGLLDQRLGQQQDYVFTPAMKGELIQQFVIDLVQQGKASGAGLSKHLKARCQCELSPRTILYHLNHMGLAHIKSTLPAYLEAVKKTP